MGAIWNPSSGTREKIISSADHHLACGNGIESRIPGTRRSNSGLLYESQGRDVIWFQQWLMASLLVVDGMIDVIFDVMEEPLRCYLLRRMQIIGRQLDSENIIVFWEK